MNMTVEKLAPDKRIILLAILLIVTLQFFNRLDRFRIVMPISRGPDVAPPLERDTYFPSSDVDIWQCSEYRRAGSYNRTFRDWVIAVNTSDEEVLCAAHEASKQPMASGTPRVAFLFMVLDDMPLEPLWRSFFNGHEGKYSLYVHPHYANHAYPPTSLFYGRKIPSKPLNRFDISQPEAMRRILAYALLDSTVPNAWFSLQSETSIPVRPFPYVYDYLMRSELSFVEAFFAWEWWRTQWINQPELREDQMRKGEVWSTVHRRHAGLIVGDFYIFPKFKSKWQPWALSCEVYVPTLMHVTDPSTIANRSVTYVNWNIEGDHPMHFNGTTITAELIQGIQEQRQNIDGMYKKSHVPGHDVEESCVYNGVANSSCWLFARKFGGRPNDVRALLALRATLGF